MKSLFPALALLLLLTFPVHAEDAKEAPKAEEGTQKADADGDGNPDFRFAPDFCDFEITFPETPAVAQKCVEGTCFGVHSYTMVYDLQTTVDVTATCNPSTPEDYARYNEQVLRAALFGMIDNRNLTSHETNFDQQEKVRSASITGTGTTGTQEKIYTGQLWVGPNSVFTVQAELVGAAHEIADKSFGDILSSIKTKEGKQLPRPKAAPKAPKQNNQ